MASSPAIISSGTPAALYDTRGSQVQYIFAHDVTRLTPNIARTSLSEAMAYSASLF